MTYKQAQKHYGIQEIALAPVLKQVKTLRRKLPKVGTRKFHHLLKDWQVKLGRNRLFDLLRLQRLLAMPTKQYPSIR